MLLHNPSLQMHRNRNRQSPLESQLRLLRSGLGRRLQHLLRPLQLDRCPPTRIKQALHRRLPLKGIMHRSRRHSPCSAQHPKHQRELFHRHRRCRSESQPPLHLYRNVLLRRQRPSRRFRSVPRVFQCHHRNQRLRRLRSSHRFRSAPPVRKRHHRSRHLRQPRTSHRCRSEAILVRKQALDQDQPEPLSHLYYRVQRRPRQRLQPPRFRLEQRRLLRKRLHRCSAHLRPPVLAHPQHLVMGRRHLYLLHKRHRSVFPRLRRPQGSESRVLPQAVLRFQLGKRRNSSWVRHPQNPQSRRLVPLHLRRRPSHLEHPPRSVPDQRSPRPLVLHPRLHSAVRVRSMPHRKVVCSPPTQVQPVVRRCSQLGLIAPNGERRELDADKLLHIPNRCLIAR